MTQPYIDVFETKYKPGYMALIWHKGHVIRVVTGADYSRTRDAAAAWAKHRNDEASE